MQQIATITSKRQLTLPVSIYNQLGLKAGQKVIVNKIGNAIKIEASVSLIDRLAGSVEVPADFKGKSIDEVIKVSKTQRFSKK